MSASAMLEPLLRQLAASRPADALVVAAAAHPVLPLLATRLPRTAIVTAQPAQPLPPDRRFALGLVLGALETLPADAGRALLAALRDRVAAHTVVVTDLSHAPLGVDDLRALGFRLHARDGDDAVFGFDLLDYKDKPEWLSPKHWAHPERWEKFRW